MVGNQETRGSRENGLRLAPGGAVAMPTAPLIYSAKIGSTMAGQTSQAWRQVRGEVPIEPIEVSRSDLRLTVRYRSLDDDIANSAPEPVTDFWEWRGALYRRFHCCGSYVKPAAARSPTKWPSLRSRSWPDSSGCSTE